LATPQYVERFPSTTAIYMLLCVTALQVRSLWDGDVALFLPR